MELLSRPEMHIDERRQRAAIIERMLCVVDGFVTDYQEEERGRDVRVDPELREGIAVLLSMGINTDASCFGHPERRGESLKDDEALPEYNLLPYISISGYLPGDGEDTEGQAIGYTDEQVEAACVRAEQNHKMIYQVLQQFHQTHPKEQQLITIQYSPGMPVLELNTRGVRQIDTLPIEEQDRLISAARHAWQDFLSFLKETYLLDEMHTFRPVPYSKPLLNRLD